MVGSCRLAMAVVCAYALGFWTKHQINYNSDVISHITKDTYDAYAGESKLPADGGPSPPRTTPSVPATRTSRC